MSNSIFSEHLWNRLGAAFVPDLFKPPTNQSLVCFLSIVFGHEEPPFRGGRSPTVSEGNSRCKSTLAQLANFPSLTVRLLSLSPFRQYETCAENGERLESARLP